MVGINQSTMENASSGMAVYESIINGQQGYILWGIVFVIIVILGCIGNILTIIVLKREAIVSTLNILLIALAISDILAPVVNALLAVSFYHLGPNYSNSPSYMIFNDILRYIIQPLGTMFTMISSWTVTTTTMFRLIAVQWPFKARTLINRRFAIISLMIIFSFSLASILPIYAKLELAVKCTPDRQSQYWTLGQAFMSEQMQKLYIPMLQTLCFYLPWLLALTFWLFLLKTLKRSEKNFNNMSSVSKESSLISPLLHPSSATNGSSGGTIFFNHSSNLNGKKLSLNRPSLIESTASEPPQQQRLHANSITRNSSIMLNTESRINNAQRRKNSYNKITLMVVVLCFTNLICRVFTFVFIFELIYDQYALQTTMIRARERFPKFLSYSLLLNNIFLAINHSSNILIYSFTNPRFKQNLIMLFRESFVCRLFSKKLADTEDKSRRSVNLHHSISRHHTYHSSTKACRPGGPSDSQKMKKLIEESQFKEEDFPTENATDETKKVISGLIANVCHNNKRSSSLSPTPV